MKRRAAILVAAATAAAPGCAAERAGNAGDTPADSAAAAAPAPPDSLALSLGDGIEVWYTMAREADSAGGTPCLERTLEIRHPGGTRVGVPLLYTRDMPKVVNDSTLEARLSGDCVPGERYRIDIRSGRPTPVRR